MEIRSDWTLNELNSLYELPLLSLISRAHRVHVQFHQPEEIQVCYMISIKSGGCPEDCRFCAQSSRYQTPVQAQPMMSYEEVLSLAKKALSRGVTRVCLGAAWTGVRDGKQFDEILRIVKEITSMGVEVCCTLGLLNDSQAERLKAAGLYAYNHNLETSEEFYKTIVTTKRTYQARVQTLDVVQRVGLSMCSGGLIGLGETIEDRLEMLLAMSRRQPHPDSFPINRLSRIPGIPLDGQAKVSTWDMIRLIAVARIVLPESMIRLTAGREEMSTEEQALCFLAGANSCFIGEKLLTVANIPQDQDEEMFRLLGIKKQSAFAKL